MTQPSTTLNRRYVSRPTNLAIEEAAQSTVQRRSIDEPNTPSRLVNLRVHNSDLERAAIQPPATPKPQPVFMLEADNTQPSTTTSPVEQSVNNNYETNTPNLNDLALNIAADYTTASMGAALSSIPAQIDNNANDKLTAAIEEERTSDSIDEIARTAAESIAAIRAATDPTDIAEQITALEKFAEQIKSDTRLPEVAELGETIEKFIKIASKSTGVQEELNKKKLLSAKANRAANKITKSSAKVITNSKKISTSTGVKKTILGHSANLPRTTHVAAKPATLKPTPSPRRPSKRTTSSHSLSSLRRDEDFALQKALSSVAEMDDEEEYTAKQMRRGVRRKGGIKRFALALGCATACVAAIIYFVGSNMPDISVRVAAMQTGVDASYPSYIPHGFSLDEINSENGKITLKFSNSENKSFTLIEEKSSWDSAALLRNYVEPTWHESYTTTHEQGITIYMYGASAAWVNGGVLYKIDCASNVLTKKQLRNIVTSIQ